ncbi:MAG: hypothetical protein ACRC7O_07785, partial [Fimbriiglobus sp.]
MNHPTDSPSPAANPSPTLPPESSNASPRPAGPKNKPRRRLLPLAVGVAVVGGIAAFAFGGGRAALAPYVPFLAAAPRADLITHVVKRESLPVTVVERGTLESANNQELTCLVKAGSKGTFASTIRWVIDDGSLVNKGQLLMELDDSSLQDNHQAQSILVEKAQAEWVRTDEEYVITLKQNESDVAAAVAALKVAQLDVEKYVGLRADPTNEPYGAAIGAIAVLEERGEYNQRLDDVSSRLKLAESDLEAYRDRSGWAAR